MEIWLETACHVRESFRFLLAVRQFKRGSRTRVRDSVRVWAVKLRQTAAFETQLPPLPKSM